MDYDDVVAASFAARPAGTPLPAAVTAGSAARRLRDACEPIAMHAVWSRHTNARLAECGLDFMGAYVAGRAASLGEPSAAVVAATFAWFDPAMIAAVYQGARSTLPTAELITLRDNATRESLAEVLAGESVEETADLLVAATANAAFVGHPLFAGLRARGRPDDAVGRLWWACDLVREHRGDSHIAAVTDAGLNAVEMNVLTEVWVGMPLLSYTATRRWSADAMKSAVRSLGERGWLAEDALTDMGRAARDQIEAHTDAQEEAIVAVLGDRLDGVCESLNRWAQLCIEAGAFPADTLKRAAG